MSGLYSMPISNVAESADHKSALNHLSTLSGNERWYAVHTLPYAEARAERHLLRQRFRTFQPKRHKTVRHARKLSTVEAPYFPRYLFIILDMAHHQWRSVNGTIGVSRLVMRGDQPNPVPRGVVEALIEAADARGIVRLGAKLEVGERVRLMAGPFAEQVAILDNLDDAGRVKVLLHILGRRVAISTDATNV